MPLLPSHTVEMHTSERAAAKNETPHDHNGHVETEEAARNNAEIDALRELTGDTAHELNNLLMVLIGNLDLIEHRAADSSPEGRTRTGSYIANARRAAWDCTRLTQQLLAASRRDSARMEIADINSAIRDSSDFLEHTLGKSIEIAMNLSDEAWLADVDLVRFEAALLTIAANARDVMPKGGRLEITTQNKHIESRNMLGKFDSLAGDGPLPADYVIIAVSDSSPAIDPAVLPPVSEPRLTAKTSGRGLSHVHHFVRQSRGYLGIARKPSIGTTVTLCLPRATSLV